MIAAAWGKYSVHDRDDGDDEPYVFHFCITCYSNPAYELCQARTNFFHYNLFDTFGLAAGS